MARSPKDPPINVSVQLLFAEGRTSILRDLHAAARRLFGSCTVAFRQSGLTLTLADGRQISGSLSRVETGPHGQALTLSTRATAAQPGTSEQSRLAGQTEVLRPFSALLGAAETLWHVLPGVLSPAEEQKLAQRSITINSRGITRGQRAARLTGGRNRPPEQSVDLGTLVDFFQRRDHQRAEPELPPAPQLANVLPDMPRPDMPGYRRTVSRLARNSIGPRRFRFEARLGTEACLKLKQSRPRA